MAISKNGVQKKAAKKSVRPAQNGGKTGKMAGMPEIRVDEARAVIEIPYDLGSEVLSESGKSAIIGGTREYPFEYYQLDSGEVIGVKAMVILTKVDQ